MQKFTTNEREHCDTITMCCDNIVQEGEGGSAKFCCDTNKIFRTKQTRRKQAKTKTIKNSNLKSH